MDGQHAHHARLNREKPLVTQSKKTDLRDNVARIHDRPSAQVLVIGGGINGIATFRDLALQGVDVVLVERADYGSGASAASSHMIHGGIRYLENGEFRLVRESVEERNGLIRIAPHYVKPLQTTMPIFSTFSGILNAPLRMLTHKQRSTKERGALLISVGMTLYDSFSRDGGSVPRHRFRIGKAAREDMPALNKDVKFTGTYYDASVHEPERLALDVLKDGLAAGDHARSANYLEAVGVADGGVTLRDVISGAEFVVKADVVVNASGPWTDLTNEAMGGETKFMGGTKGSHIVVDNAELLEATKGREIFFENNDGRIVLIYPLKGRVLIGTTDIDADPSEPAVCTEEEVDYFFDLVKHVFPQIELNRDHIVYRYSGIRPLPRHEDTAPGFVSRDYRIVETEIAGLAGSKVLSLVGGKWTTFRALSAHLSTEATTRLGVERSVDTTGMPIGGGKDFPSSSTARARWIATQAARAEGIGTEQVDRLLNRYGTRATSVIDVLSGQPSTPLATDPQLTRAEIAYFATHEDAVHLADVVLRRTNLAFVGGVTHEMLAEIADVLQDALGWTGEERDAEIQDTVDTLLTYHGVDVGATKVASDATVTEFAN
ncbi:Aerobic glycerol-3-phosphate dehydrogenase [Clavibacter michiganensis subsp. michiganensis]|uniref:Aerobic glycerol-3-phosphate dehydrogenase n=2 Tax=Clavibacter michiganensis TaxID=28447 RepID=A0A251XHV4_CLAMM|nr:glycerol-3-phosphate dehydrogenase/oxidase [Clavibacter michiganensis]KAF0259602.1 Aerobic glycerol-3-phosphate dehydrogenase [Clavibacter michiganensis subsp. michiganensis]OUD85275.1 Aerobic glycerol-3-phosphate dehydrogenase [Clavibacter michiganensis subsp. michiganensis]OUE02665.1 Aerobic glycerol-3-phosphate dehydrogenase [Clavibacter michiganensis subsp. michiganensis]